jgi:hypothetical protein
LAGEESIVSSKGRFLSIFDGPVGKNRSVEKHPKTALFLSQQASKIDFWTCQQYAGVLEGF